MSIEKLPEDIINQIAAGEVIENPSAVIKELVENSIDSGATQIEISLENYGKNRISVKDNGCGISKEDLSKAPLRHATSKIKSFEDLYSIKTMGFRGEALASIFAIAKTKILSKQKNGAAFEISSEGKKVIPSACMEGTCVHVENLFYNTPARKKYLKSDNLELKSVLEIMNRFITIHYNKKFTLIHNGKILISKPEFKTLEDNLTYIFGKEIRGNLFNVNLENKGIKITGFLGKPSSISYSYKKNQFIFVNKRFIKSRLIQESIYDGIGSNLMDNRHPFFVLEIDIDPEIIDVNIHPTKIEVKFENEVEIYDLVKNAINLVFESQQSFKDFEPSEVNLDLYDTINLDSSFQGKEIKKEKSYFSKDFQKSFEIKENNISYQNKSKLEVVEEDSLYLNSYGPLYDILSEYKILGQLNKTYILIEAKDGFYLLDQHVAEEKYYYELFKEYFQNNKRQKSQTLLSPVTIKLSPTEMLDYNENKFVLDSLGFDSEIFGESDIIVRSVPISIKNIVVNPVKIKDYLYEILINKKIKCVEEENYEKIASMACRTAIMAGDELSFSRMKFIVENLRRLKQPFNCPHGRPAFLKYDFKELEKKFKRIV